jgi:hypothetical protein
MRRELNPVLFKFAITGLLVFDLWRVDVHLLRYSDSINIERFFQKPDFIEFIQRDTSIYRVIELNNGQPVTSNYLAYFRLHNAYGYHAAKMRAYQDLIDIAGITNPFVLDLLNVRYIISDRVDTTYGELVFEGRRKVILNSDHLPRAFFVRRYEVAEAFSILTKMKFAQFDPSEVLYFEDDPGIYVEPVRDGAYVKFVEYKPQYLKLKVRATGENLLFISDVYYPKWKCYIDGVEVPIYKANYTFRAILVPEGEHVVEFKYEDYEFEIGRSVSFGISLIVVAGLVFHLFGSLLRKLKR